MAGVLNDIGPFQVCRTMPPAREPSPTLFTTVTMKSQTHSHQYVSSHLITPGLSEEEHLCFRYYSSCAKARGRPPNACVLRAFKKTLSGEGELALLPLLLLLLSDTCTVSYYRHIKEPPS